jgi:hypothetical protein
VPENRAAASTSRDRREYARRVIAARDPVRLERKRLRATWDAWLTARRAGRDVDMPPFVTNARASRPEQPNVINDVDVAPAAALVAPSPAPRRRSRSPSYTYAQIVAVLGPALSENRQKDRWRWKCGCTAFIREPPIGAYLWMRCDAHAGVA